MQRLFSQTVFFRSLFELLQNKQQNLFEFTQSDFDILIQSEIANMVANVQRKHGKAEVFMGLYK